MHQTVSHLHPLHRLPAGPLLEALEARAPWGSRARQLGGAGRRAYWRARTEGTLTIKAAAQLAAVLELEPAAVYGPAWTGPSAAVVEDRGRRRRLPVGPLLEALEVAARRSGRSRSALLGGERSPLSRALQRAQAAGVVTLQLAERLCDLLDVHPYQLWREDYDRAALQGAPADVWEGVA